MLLQNLGTPSTSSCYRLRNSSLYYTFVESDRDCSDMREYVNDHCSTKDSLLQKYEEGLKV